jgi:hypothetical protein
VVLAFVLISAHYIREEVQDWYEDHYDRDDDGHEYHGKAGGPPKGWSAVPSLPSDGIKPGMLLVHPEQEGTVRALILELMVRFNRITYKCENLVKLGGSGSQFKDEGMWPVCFDAPYWKNGRIGDHKRLDTGSDKLNEGAKGNCVQYTFGVDWDFRWAANNLLRLESDLFLFQLSFDDDFHKKTGCDSHSFDPSMEMESKQRTDHTWFWNLGVSDKKDTIKGTGMRSGKQAMWQVDTVQGHMKKLGHKHVSLLKIDVEGFEWVVLRQVGFGRVCFLFAVV